MTKIIDANQKVKQAIRELEQLQGCKIAQIIMGDDDEMFVVADFQSEEELDEFIFNNTQQKAN